MKLGMLVAGEGHTRGAPLPWVSGMKVSPRARCPGSGDSGGFVRTLQEGCGCQDCPGHGNFLRSSREAGTHPALPSSHPPIHHNPQVDGPPGADPGVRWFTEARQLTSVCKRLYKPRRKCRQRLDPPEGPLEPRGLAQAKTLDSWGWRVWTSQPTCSGKSTPS